MSVRAAGSALALVLFAASPALAAPTAKPDPAAAAKKAECVAALDKAQASRASRKLTDARASYVTCSYEQCPDMIRDDCSKGLREVDEALPSITLAASIDGHDATDANVSLDGNPIEGGLDGRSIPVDPGSHLARFERPGSAAVEVKIVAREGQKNQLITGTFLSTHPPEKTAKAEGANVPIVPIVFAGTGVVALGAALIVHLSMVSRANDLVDKCAPTCPQADRDSLSDRLVLRNAVIGIGIGALVVAAVTYVVTARR